MISTETDPITVVFDALDSPAFSPEEIKLLADVLVKQGPKDFPPNQIHVNLSIFNNSGYETRYRIDKAYKIIRSLIFAQLSEDSDKKNLLQFKRN